MKIQKDGLIKSGCWAKCNHIHQRKISPCLIYCNIKIGEVYHTQRADEKKALLMRSASSLSTLLLLLSE